MMIQIDRLERLSPASFFQACSDRMSFLGTITPSHLSKIAIMKKINWGKCYKIFASINVFTTVKSFITLAPGINVIKLFYFVTDDPDK